ncbi:hypothetical protein RJ640_030873 [Escallonia rubra]|uniref:Uncharacterized protein n=1 Tax=Escallonia rubra TaxID=112253 RepID=A0AA88S7W2_9ASTE|nr:hypothetical protein RJ640_030873 [Escallonia rubra]
MATTGGEGNLSQIPCPELLDYFFLVIKVFFFLLQQIMQMFARSKTYLYGLKSFVHPLDILKHALHLKFGFGACWGSGWKGIEISNHIPGVLKLMVTSFVIGTRLLSFGTSQILQNAAASSAWAGAAKTENDVVQFNGHPPLNYIDPESSFPVSSMHSYKGVSQFQFSRGTDHILPEASVCQQLLLPNSASGNDRGNSPKMFSGGLNRAGNSDHALSLLSSATSQSCSVGSSHVTQPKPVTLAPSSIHNLHFSSLSQCPFTRDMESKPVVSDLDSIGRNYTTLHFQGMFQNEPEGSSASEDQKTLTFGWE